MTIDTLLQSIPPLAVYGMVGAVVGVESLGIPLPGEVVLVSAALMSSRNELAVNPVVGRAFTGLGARGVFFGRFIALLRIFAGPLAGALKMRYARFLLANVSGALCWAGGTTALVYYAGMAAERWLTRFSWIALLLAVVCGGIAAILLRERTSRAIADLEAEHSGESDPTAA